MHKFTNLFNNNIIGNFVFKDLLRKSYSKTAYASSSDKPKPVDLKWLENEVRGELAELEGIERCKRLLEKHDCSVPFDQPDCPSVELLSKYSYEEIATAKTSSAERIQRIQKLQELQEAKESANAVENSFHDFANFILKPFLDLYEWVNSIIDLQICFEIWYSYVISNPYEMWLIFLISVSITGLHYLESSESKGKYR